MDSNGLYYTITALHEFHDYHLRSTVYRMRVAFETGEMHTMQWIPGEAQDRRRPYQEEPCNVFNSKSCNENGFIIRVDREEQKMRQKY